MDIDVQKAIRVLERHDFEGTNIVDLTKIAYRIAAGIQKKRDECDHEWIYVRDGFQPNKHYKCYKCLSGGYGSHSPKKTKKESKWKPYFEKNTDAFAKTVHLGNFKEFERKEK